MTRLPWAGLINRSRPEKPNRSLAALLQGRLATAVAILALLSGALVENRAWAEGVVTNCSELALTSALAGGGLVSFTADCTLRVTHTIYIGATTNTTIDSGGHHVTISGGGTVPIFNVASDLTLKGLTLANGKSTNAGGALYISPGATVSAQNCIFVSNSVAGPNGINGLAGSTNSGAGGTGGSGASGTSVYGGAICNQGNLSLITCVLSNNTATAGNGGQGGAGGTGTGTLSQGGDGGPGGAGGHGFGGGIYNSGNLTLADCTIAGNSATGGNGGAGGAAGSGAFLGLAAAGGAASGGYGGGIYNVGNISINSSTLSGNNTRGGNSAAGGSQHDGTGTQGPDGGSAFGGGLCNASWGAVTNSTFYNNTATGGTGGNGGNGTGTFPTRGNGGNGGNGVGGCAQNFGTLTLVNCTVMLGTARGGTNGVAGSGNFGGNNGQPGQAQGGNLANTSGSFTLKNSLIAWASWGNCGYGTISDGGYNLTTDTSIPLGSTGFPNTSNPRLGSFGMHGGSTATVPLLTGSPAIDKIPPSLGPPTDQRGAPRPMPPDGLDDIGAYESEIASPPNIAQQPASLTVTQSSPATFTVSAFGASPLSYQWLLNGSPIPTNATSSSYTVSTVFSSNQGPYSVVISNYLGSITSSPAMANLGVSITAQPTNHVVLAGTDVSFAVAAAGDSPLYYQWQFNGTNIANATNSTLQLPSVQVTNVGTYTVSVSNSNSVSGVTSASATLNLLPTILSQPSSLTVAPGGQASFQVSATGTPTLNYQWTRNGSPISGATLAGYTNSSVQIGDAGSYQVRISNSFGGTNSATATLNVVMGLSGSVLEGTNGLPGVHVTIGTNQIVTAADGSYTATLPSGTYVLLPSMTNYGFSPTNWTLTLVGPTNNINFAGFPLIRLTPMTNGASQIYGGGITGLTYQVEASTNLIQWQPISTNVAPIQFLDPATGQPQKFYRFSR